MNKSEQINELAAALAKAQAELKNPHFDSTNPHFRSKFASLAAVRDAVIPVLAKHGLSITQWPTTEGNLAGCQTLLSHSSGQWIEQSFLLPVDKVNAHGFASALTYTRRLSMQSVAGVVGDEDDDGNEAAGSKPDPVKQLVNANVKPNAGAGDELPPEKKEAIRARAISITEAIKKLDSVAKAMKIADEVQDLEEKRYLWSLLDSKTRSAITKAAQERKVA